MIKISIIIPIYNSEKYVKKCLDSIVNQTYSDIEIICINDGSTDKSLEILTEYKEKDSRIIIINKENGGVSSARNEGLKVASGKYISFVDADDYIDKNCYKTAIEYLEKHPNIELYKLNAEYILNRECNNSEYSFKKRWYSNRFFGEQNLSKNNIDRLPGVVWSYIFKSNIIKNNNIYFENFKIYEDVLFLFKYLKFIQNLYYAKDVSYYYVAQDGSAVTKYVPENNFQYAFTSWINISTILYKFYKDDHKIDIFNENIYPRLYSWINCSLQNIKSIEDRKVALDKLCELTKVLSPAFKWGSIIDNIRNNTPYKIDRLNIPYLNWGNKFLGLALYRNRKPYIQITFLGCKLKIHYQKIFNITNNIAEKHKVINILGLKIKFDIKSTPSKRFSKFVKKVFSITNSNHHKIITIIGLNIKIRKRNKQHEEFRQIIQEEIQHLELNNNKLLSQIARLISISNLHQKTFSKFKNIHYNQTVALLGAGPSLNHFTKIDNAKYVGLNRVFLLDKINLDYIFTIDNNGLNQFYEEFINYRPKECIKFIGDQNYKGSLYQIPEYIAVETNSLRYKTTASLLPDRFTYDIDSEPLGNFCTVSLQAMQFILWTHPKKIYIVGIDCNMSKAGHFKGKTNDGSFRNENPSQNDNYSIKSWHNLKSFLETYYPDIEIISINPVGLRGLFRDVYTESYLEANPDLKKELGDDIEILNYETQGALNA